MEHPATAYPHAPYEPAAYQPSTCPPCGPAPGEQEPYRTRSRRDTVNPEDAVFDAVGDATLLDPAPLADGYAGAITLVLADPAGC